jgi:hypothetical protein
MTEVAQGLSFLNDVGVTHRDIKPHNIMILARLLQSYGLGNVELPLLLVRWILDWLQLRGIIFLTNRQHSSIYLLVTNLQDSNMNVIKILTCILLELF